MKVQRILFALMLAVCASSSVAADVVSFDDLAKHAQYQEVKISPDGRYIATTAIIKDRAVLAITRLSDLKGFKLKQTEVADIVDFWWVSPMRVIYTQGLHDSNYDQPLADGRLFAVNADGSGKALLYGYGSEKPWYGEAELIATIPDDPQHVLIAVANDDAATRDGVLPLIEKMDVDSGSMEKVGKAPIRNAEFVADHKGNPRFAYTEDNDGSIKVYSSSGSMDDWQLMSDASAARDLPISFDSTDTLTYFTCKVPGGFGICTWNVGSGQMKTIWMNSKVESTGLTRGPAEDNFLGVDFEDGRPGIALFDPQSEDAKILVALMQQFPGEDVQFISSTRDGSRAIVYVAADADPGTFYLFDRATRKLTMLLHNAPWINPERMASKQPFEFTARDGMKLQGYVTYPPGMENAKHLPTVVYVHGGPYGVRDWWEYDSDLQAVATRGFAVLQVNFRGSGGYGYDFVKAGWMQWGGAMQDDVTDATRWAIAQGIADPNRICIYGASYGGYAALEGAVKEPDLYKCTIGYVGVYDLGLMYRRGDTPESTGGKNYLKRVLGTDERVLADHSPVNQLDHLKAAVMLIVGGEDGRVPPIQGQNLRSALRSRNIPFEWLYQDKESHGFYKEANVADLYEKVDMFLQAHIGSGVVAADSGTNAAAAH